MSKRYNGRKKELKKAYNHLYDIMSKNKKIKPELSEDSKLRMDIHKIIIEGLREGITEEDIIKMLTMREDMKKFEEYFKGWIEHQKSKMGKERYD